MSKRMLFVGGGSSGHTAPLFAVIEKVYSLDTTAVLHYAGSSHDIASSVVSGSSIPIRLWKVPAGKLHRFLTIRQIGETLRFILALVVVPWVLLRIRPTLVFLKGGAVSVPFALWSRVLAIPLYSHETDIAAGIANKVAARAAIKVFTSFPPEWYPDIPEGKAVYSGQPVRDIFFEKQQWQFDTPRLDLPLIVVTGGSLGAQTINEVVSQVWSRLLVDFQVVHQCGPHDSKALFEKAKNASPRTARQINSFSFLRGRSNCRGISAGFSSDFSLRWNFFELAACKAPSILIPLPTSAQNHQQKNAERLAAEGAAVLLNQKELNPERLLEEVRAVLQTEKSQQLSRHITHFSEKSAALTIAKALLS